MRVRAHDWSAAFLKTWNDDRKMMDIEQYDACMGEWRRAHERKMIVHYSLTILCFCAGLWAVWEQAFFASVLLLLIRHDEVFMPRT
jgi:hypothetical protein